MWNNKYGMDEINFFFSGWQPLLRIVIVGTLAYISLIVLLRVSGKRSIAHMSGFDFVITIAIGSTFGRLITAESVSLAESVVAFLVLILLQYMMSYLNIRNKSFSKLVKSEPTLLFFRGAFLEQHLKHERIRKEEILSAIRQEKIGSLDAVEAVVLESAGSFAVIKREVSTTDLESSTLKPLLEAGTAKGKEID